MESLKYIEDGQWLQEMLALITREPQQDKPLGKSNQALIAEFIDERGIFAA